MLQRNNRKIESVKYKKRKVSEIEDDDEVDYEDASEQLLREASALQHTPEVNTSTVLKFRILSNLVMSPRFPMYSTEIDNDARQASHYFKNLQIYQPLLKVLLIFTMVYQCL